MKFVKRPIEVEAYQTEKEMIIHTLEGDMKASVGDWIITGARGEQYPCKPDVFEKTYTLVTGAEDEDIFPPAPPPEVVYEYWSKRQFKKMQRQWQEKYSNNTNSEKTIQEHETKIEKVVSNPVNIINGQKDKKTMFKDFLMATKFWGLKTAITIQKQNIGVVDITGGFIPACKLAKEMSKHKHRH